MEAIERSVVLPAPPDEVWESVTDLGGWFGAEIEGEVAAGEPIRFTWPDGTERRAVIERVDRSRELTFRWLGEEPSRVDITVEPVPDGTAVRVTETRIESAVTPSPRIGFKALAKV